MKIKYTNIVEDVIALQNHYLSTSKTLKKQMLFRRFFVPSLILIMLTFTGLKKNNYGAIALGIIIFTILVLWHPSSMRNAIRKTVLKTYKENKNENILCEHELEITDSKLIEVTTEGTNSINLSSIESIHSINGYTFIYTGPGSAHMIPSSRIINGNYELFVKTINDKRECMKCALLQNP